MEKVFIIGAGPAGLAAGLQLSKNGYDVLIAESNRRYVGGLSRTVVRGGYRIDIGGHRFYTKSEKVCSFWRSLLDDSIFRARKRVSRIFYSDVLIDYPFRLFNCVRKLSLSELFSIVLSYLISASFNHKEPQNYEEWIIKRFGKKLYLIFFKSYSEKLWGTPCSEISPDWADQRIQDLSIFSIVKSLIFKGAKQKTLADSFLYPDLGPGQMWNACCDQFKKNNGSILMGHKFISANYLCDEKKWVVYVENLSDKSTRSFSVDYLISTCPIGELIRGVKFSNSERLAPYINSFTHRGMILVSIMGSGCSQNDENWLYIHDSKLKSGRIQFFHNWSSELVPNSDSVSFGVEFFSQPGRELWDRSDESLIELAISELRELGVIDETFEHSDSLVVRSAHAYPVYHRSYNSDIEKVKDILDSETTGLHLIGRNGMHRYNNQDHSVLSGMYCAENIISGKILYDPWQINRDSEYIEK